MRKMVPTDKVDLGIMAKFETVGLLELAKSKRSLKLTLDKLPNSLFTEVFYVSVKNTEAVIAGKRENVVIVMRIGEQQNNNCEVHKS